MKNMRRAALIGAAVLAGGVLGAPSAHAQMVGQATGTGSYVGMPGFGNPFAPAAPTSMQFSGTFTGTVNGAPGTCFFQLGGSGMESALVGSGTARMSCNGTTVTGGAFSAVCGLNYTRFLAYPTFTGSCLGIPGPIRLDCVAGTGVAAMINCQVS